ncbi:transposase [Prevotella nigrescens]|uniref:transposase n=1 Tax=Prevotella nigrescens TaxID=28133 RepID=UPI001BA58CA5|nr:transposase [Prevotella nigrescens]QUB51760.1 transposase [Prevotella nigrescens]
MELTQSQISEIISNYTSSSKGFITLQSLIMNSLMGHERDLFVKANEHKQCNGLRSRRWYSHAFEFSLRIPRSRSGNFYLVFSGLIRSESKEHARFPTYFTPKVLLRADRRKL